MRSANIYFLLFKDLTTGAVISTKEKGHNMRFLITQVIGHLAHAEGTFSSGRAELKKL